MSHPRSAKERDPDGTRQAILTAAEEEFAQKGFSGARIDEIAARAGYNKSLIFHYFENKLGLYQAVIGGAKGNVEQQFYAILLSSLASPEPLNAGQVASFIRQGIAESFDFLIERPTLRRILAWEAAEGWIIYRSLPTIQENVQQKLQTVAAFLQRAQVEGYLRPDLDPILLITNTLGMALIYLNSLPRYEAVFPQVDFSSAAALARARTQLIRLVLHGAMTPTSFGDVE
jgi:TetR/AcrR family transcriptional regulator